MIEVFKTNIEDNSKAENLLILLLQYFTRRPQYY